MASELSGRRPPTATDAAGAPLTEENVALRIQAALEEAKRSWDVQARERDTDREHRLGHTLAAFTGQRAAYFRRVEAEVVQLSLAIARKVLHREASLDPTLLCGLVRIAIDRLGAETPVRVRVAPEDVARWESSATHSRSANAYEVITDGSLSAGECVVETSLGTADFGIDAQLKEIEHSFLDLLSHRPESR